MEGAEASGASGPSTGVGGCGADGSGKPAGASAGTGGSARALPGASAPIPAATTRSSRMVFKAWSGIWQACDTDKRESRGAHRPRRLPLGDCACWGPAARPRGTLRTALAAAPLRSSAEARQGPPLRAAQATWRPGGLRYHRLRWRAGIVGLLTNWYCAGGVRSCMCFHPLLSGLAWSCCCVARPRCLVQVGGCVTSCEQTRPNTARARASHYTELFQRTVSKCARPEAGVVAAERSTHDSSATVDRGPRHPQPSQT